MRILVVTEDYTGSDLAGVPRVIAETGSRLAAMGDQITVMTPRLPADLPLRETIAGIEVVRYPCTSAGGAARLVSAYFGSKKAARELHREGRFEVVHSHFYLSSLGVFDSSLCRSARLVSTFHGPAHLEYLQECGGLRARNRARAGLILRLQNRILNRSDAIIVLSDYSRGLLSEMLPGHVLERVVKIHGGVDTERFSPLMNAAQARRQLALPENGPLLVCVRRLIRRNGLDLLIDAMPEVTRKHPDCTLAIVGKGDVRKELEEQSRRLGLGGSVRFEGFVPDDSLPLYYCAGDFSVMPTRSLEGFGLPILESMACGTPVIGSRCGAIPEIIEGFDSRFLLPADMQPRTVASAICDLLEDHKVTPELRDRCRQHVLENYSWDRATALLRAVYSGECTARKPCA